MTVHSSKAEDQQIVGVTFSLVHPWKACELCDAETALSCPSCGRPLCRRHISLDADSCCLCTVEVPAPPVEVPAPPVEVPAPKPITRRSPSVLGVLAVACLYAFVANLSLFGTLFALTGQWMARWSMASLGLVALQITAVVFLVVHGVAGLVAVRSPELQS